MHFRSNVRTWLSLFLPPIFSGLTVEVGWVFCPDSCAESYGKSSRSYGEGRKGEAFEGCEGGECLEGEAEASYLVDALLREPEYGSLHRDAGS